MTGILSYFYREAPVHHSLQFDSDTLFLLVLDYFMCRVCIASESTYFLCSFKLKFGTPSIILIARFKLILSVQPIIISTTSVFHKWCAWLDRAYLGENWKLPCCFLIDVLGGEQVKLLFPGGVYDTKYLAQFFPRLFPSTSLAELHIFLAPKEDGIKEDDNVDEQDGEEGNEQPASVPGAVDLSSNQESTSANPDSAVHSVNGEGSMEPSTLQTHKSPHVILADLSPCKSIFHIGRVSDYILV